MALAAAELVQATTTGSTGARLHARVLRVPPKHLPPPEVMEHGNARFLSSEMRAEEARDGNPDPLICYLQNGGALGSAEVDVMVEALEAKRGKRSRDAVHDADSRLSPDTSRA